MKKNWLLTAAETDRELEAAALCQTRTEQISAAGALHAAARAWRRKYERTRKARLRAGVEQGLRVELAESEVALRLWRERALRAERKWELLWEERAQTGYAVTEDGQRWLKEQEEKSCKCPDCTSQDVGGAPWEDGGEA